MTRLVLASLALAACTRTASAPVASAPAAPASAAVEGSAVVSVDPAPVPAPAPAPVPETADAPAAEVPPVEAPAGAWASVTGTGDISSGLDDTDVAGGRLEAPGTIGGSGGTGWGTIGTGRYGTIGHGSSGSSGYQVGGKRGGMRGRSASVPQVRIGNPRCTGPLDKNITRRFLKRALPKFQYCYEKELLTRPGLSGTVDLRFSVDPFGVVTEQQAAGVDPAVASCVAEVARSLSFPARTEATQCTYPLSFRPTGG